jgi:hypothetical protein
MQGYLEELILDRRGTGCGRHPHPAPVDHERPRFELTMISRTDASLVTADEDGSRPLSY